MKALALFIDGSENDRESVATALAYCRRLGGRLEVIHPIPPFPAIMSESMMLPEEAGRENAATAAARAAFDAVCGNDPSARWRPVNSAPVDAVRSVGLLNDLIILERLNSEDGPDAEALNIALMEVGSPVLICPPHPVEAVARSVAIIWRANRQSARALKAALPLLTGAETVTVFTDMTDEGTKPAPVIEYLAAHGIPADSRDYDSTGLTARARARALMKATDSVGADLFVMGAYGESLLSSLTGLGRATRKIVTATRIPALIAH